MREAMRQCDRIVVKVEPTMSGDKHPLAAVSGASNAIFVDSREAGQLMFLGQGAGGAPTASAVMGDVVTAARNRARGTVGHIQEPYARREIAPVGDAEASFYVSFDAVDRPGVLARCAAIFGEHGVSLRNVQQNSPHRAEGEGFAARLGVMTHTTTETHIAKVIEALRAADFVDDEIRMMRVEGA